MFKGPFSLAQQTEHCACSMLGHKARGNSFFLGYNSYLLSEAESVCFIGGNLLDDFLVRGRRNYPRGNYMMHLLPRQESLQAAYFRLWLYLCSEKLLCMSS